MIRNLGAGTLVCELRPVFFEHRPNAAQCQTFVRAGFGHKPQVLVKGASKVTKEQTVGFQLKQLLDYLGGLGIPKKSV